MKSKKMKPFKERAAGDGNLINRANFRENYAEFEKYCKQHYGKGNFLDWAAEQFNILNESQEYVIELVKLNTIKSHNFNFEISPNIENATSLLRKELLDSSIKTTYTKSPNRATFELLSLVRNNLNHQNKSEMDEDQYLRNYNIVKFANLISEILLNKIEHHNK